MLAIPERTVDAAFDTAHREADRSGHSWFVAVIGGVPYALERPNGRCVEVKPASESGVSAISTGPQAHEALGPQGVGRNAL